MEDQQDDLDDELLAAQAEEYVGGYAQRLAERLLSDPDPAAAVAALVEELKSDEGGVLLLGRAFEDGKRETLLSAAKYVGDSGPDHVWSGVGGGERRALWTEQHLCLECDKASVCTTARSIPVEHLVQVRRCLAFSPSER